MIITLTGDFQFLPRNAMLSRDVSPPVRLSVCLSVIRRYSVETAKIFSNFFSPPDSHTILVFPHQMVWQYSDEDPPNGVTSNDLDWSWVT